MLRNPLLCRGQGEAKRKMNKKIYIVRHGETEFNKLRVVQGSGVDCGLNEMGRIQAAAFYNAYKNFSFDKIYISQLLRTQETVQQFIDDGIPFEKLEGLNEISWGKYEGQPHTMEFDAEYWQRVADWKNGLLDLPIHQGESPNQLAARQKIALDFIMKNEKEKNILICMHGRAIKSFLCVLQNISLTHMDDFEHRNLGLYSFIFDGKIFEMQMRNDAAHLTGIDVVNDIT